MPNISEEKWIEMLEKKADGTYVIKYPKVKSKSGVTFDEHLADNANPHSVTKAQVGLGNVQNYGIATKEEAEAGIINTAYVTPLRVKEAISALAGNAKIVYGSYTGNGQNKTIQVGFRPDFVFITTTSNHGISWGIVRGVFGISSEGSGEDAIQIVSNGFTVGGGTFEAGRSGDSYKYIAIKGV